MVLPATVFLVAAVLRLLQPPQYEPARTSWVVFGWTTSHISRSGAGALFIALPALTAFVGCAVFFHLWKGNQSFREDASLAFSILRRNIAVSVMLAGTVLAAAILAFSVLHVITD